jgi:hypothetical protein
VKIFVLRQGGIDRSKPDDNIAEVREVPDLPNPPGLRKPEPEPPAESAD